MLTFLVYVLLATGVFALFTHGFITTALYSLNAVMQPSYLWKWTFPDVSISKYLAISCILSWLILAAKKRIDFSIYKQKPIYYLISIWLLMHISNWLSPYPYYQAGVRAETVLSTMNSIIIMLLVQLGISSYKEYSRHAILAFVGIFVFTGAYYVYWANDLYLGGNWWAFTNGRLNGPSQGPYVDQNVLSSMIVMVMPFILLAYFYLNNKILKYCCVFIIPLLWHSLFLFGSRGAMLGLGATTLLIAYTMEKSIGSTIQIKPWQIKTFKTIMLLGLIGAVIWQGGEMLNRSTETVSKAQTNSEEPLNPRIVSWKAAIKITKEYPLLGAGPQRFQWAAQDLALGTPHVAHNTLFNFMANTGIIVATLFILLLCHGFKSYFEANKLGAAKDPLLDYLNKATTISLLGYTVCGTFLDLIIFEPIYFLFILITIKNHSVKNYCSKQNEQIKPKKNQPQRKIPVGY